ncbi:MAG: NADH-quinone oxidoreductase subunit L [Chthoniobacterales bacterium]
MSLQTVPWIILFAPLVAATLILFFGKYSKPLSAGLAIATAALGCVLSWLIFLHPPAQEGLHFDWVNFALWQQAGIPAFHIPIGIVVDPLSRVMLLVVTTIATLVFTYSIGYMRTEEGYSRYFAGLTLFLFSMLGIVLADNFIMMFIFWELVGVSSYILIGHYYSKNSAADAGKQAFLVNRIGDFGFMIGILLLWVATGSIVFSEIVGKLTLPGGLASHLPFLTIACILVFCGTIGKSAQLPLHVWLPNSMEGPTPVSSLLHAATMVAAGVYMLARIFPILILAPGAREVIAWVGAITLFVAALMATQQNDIKRILAYSTISQLGYMVLGIGVAPTADVAMFHLFTHASFKCLLFLCAGSIIVAMHHEQDIWKMGALKNKMPLTFLCCFAGAVALSAVPGTSGYFSKDLIIEFSWANTTFHHGLFWLALATAALTAFYTARLFLVVFFGPPRDDHAKHCEESPKVMILPMAILACSAIACGWPVIQKHFFDLPEVVVAPPMFHIMTLVALALGLVGACLLYWNAEKDPISIPLFANRFYIDNFYTEIVKFAQDRVGVVFSWIDRWVIDLGVRISAKLAVGTGFTLRLLQVGNIQAYAFYFGAGVIILIYLLLR